MSMRIGDVELLGVTLIDIPPIGVVHVELSPGLTALYGVNGAGKTRILEGLRSALTGIRTTAGAAYLHIRVADELYSHENGWPYMFQAAVASSVREAQAETMRLLAQFRDDVYASDDDAWDDYATGLKEFADRVTTEEFSPVSLREGVTAHLDARLAWPSSSALAEGYRWHEKELREVVGQGYFTLQADGRQDSRWLIHAAADMSAGSTFRRLFADDFNSQLGFNTLVAQARAGQLDAEGIQKGLEHLPTGAVFPWLEVHAISPGAVLDSLHEHLGRWTESTWPTWACMPVMETGEIGSAPITVVDSITEINQPDLDDATLEAVLEVSDGNPIEILMESDVVYKASARSLIEDRERQAQSLASLVLSPAPRVEFDLGRPQKWLRGGIPRWKADVGGSPVRLESLSWAERRWCGIGIALANATTPTDLGDNSVRADPRVLLCDEPERGLHRRAEHHLPSALHNAAVAVDAPVIVATHSPALLNDPRVVAVHVSRDRSGGRTTARALRTSTRSALDRELLIAELGLTPADLLQMTRVFVLVEGIHDRIVVEELLGDDLDAGYATCLPVGGAKTLSTLVDSELMFNFTDAQIIVVIDNLTNKVVSPAWTRLTEGHASGDERIVDGALRDLEKVPGGEARWLRNLAGQAILVGKLDRIHIHGLREPDVICYLPAKFFVHGTEDWAPLLKAWRAHHAPKQPTDLKGWLRDQRKARIAKKTIEEAAHDCAAQGRPIHEDLTSLGLRIRELATWDRRRDQSGTTGRAPTAIDSG